MKYLNEIKALLEEEHSKSQTNAISNFVQNDAGKMKALMSFFLDKKWDWRYNQWLLGP